MNVAGSSSAAAPTKASSDGTQRKLRMKRVFLRTLIASLAISGGVAVVALLAGTFTETTAKILLTLGALAVHSGFALAAAAALERGRWPALNRRGFLVFAINFVVLIACIWWPTGLDEQVLRAMGETGILLAAYLLAIPGAAFLESARSRVLGGASVALVAAATAMWLVCVWADPRDDHTFLKATLIMSLVAFSSAHSCLLWRLPRVEMAGRLVWLTLAAAWGVTGLGSLMILFELEQDYLFRWLGALGVVDACGSLAVLIMARLGQTAAAERMTTTSAQVELRCPRCLTGQTITAGKCACTACGLKFRLEIEEPRCAKCDYVLWQLPERRCPECGTEF